jgi:hypothetical protein
MNSSDHNRKEFENQLSTSWILRQSDNTYQDSRIGVLWLWWKKGYESVNNEWREAVIEQHITNHTLEAIHKNNPRQAIQDLINWEIDVALDPSISSSARALIEQGRKLVLKEIADKIT